MTVSEIMSKNVVSVPEDEPVALAARLMSRNNIGSLPVCGADGRLCGVVTDRDIVLRCVANGGDPAGTPVGEIMSRSVISVSPGDDVARASDLMSAGQVRRLPVAEDGRLLGYVALCDLARRGACDMEASRALCEISENLRRR